MIPKPVLNRWAALGGGATRPLTGGLINASFLVECDPPVVVQKLHAVFKPEVNEDIDALTAHLGARGMKTPRLILTDDGAFSVQHEGDTWRALTFVQGETLHQVESPAVARAAGALVGRFHAALADFEHEYAFTRPGVHDTVAHLAGLKLALRTHARHRLLNTVAVLADQLLTAAESLPDLRALTTRHCHGDLKISNLLFDDAGEGVCLVDLDTIGRMTLPFELGDALRSWCNPAGEDAPGRLDLERLGAAIEGYRKTAPKLAPEEVEHIIDGLAVISLELSARFLADALNESYFGWDDARFKTRGEHNLARAESQLALFRSVREQELKARALTTKLHLP